MVLRPGMKKKLTGKLSIKKIVPRKLKNEEFNIKPRIKKDKPEIIKNNTRTNLKKTYSSTNS